MIQMIHHAQHIVVRWRCIRLRKHSEEREREIKYTFWRDTQAVLYAVTSARRMISYTCCQCLQKLSKTAFGSQSAAVVSIDLLRLVREKLCRSGLDRSQLIVIGINFAASLPLPPQYFHPQSIVLPRTHYLSRSPFQIPQMVTESFIFPLPF